MDRLAALAYFQLQLLLVSIVATSASTCNCRCFCCSSNVGSDTCLPLLQGVSTVFIAECSNIFCANRFPTECSVNQSDAPHFRIRHTNSSCEILEGHNERLWVGSAGRRFLWLVLFSAAVCCCCCCITGRQHNPWSTHAHLLGRSQYRAGDTDSWAVATARSTFSPGEVHDPYVANYVPYGLPIAAAVATSAEPVLGYAP
eukprot:5391871-Pleurochrysis_carterae.AAC.2